MANVEETGSAGYDWAAEGVYQLEGTDKVQGGAGGIANRQATELAKRTRNLHDRLSTAETQKAGLDSPALSGVPTAPTADSSNNSTQVATTAFVKALFDLLLNGVPGTADTFLELYNEILSNDTAIDALNAATGLKLNKNFDNVEDQAAARAALGLGAVALLSSISIADVAGLQAALDSMLLADSPNFTGVPTAPTAVPGTNTTQIANTAFVQAAISVLTDSAPAVLDTFKEFADALGNDPNYAATMATALAGKLAKANNLSDLNDAATARVNLGLGALAVLATIGYDQVGSEFKNDLTITANDIDWATGWYKKITFVGDVSWTFSNVKKGKDIHIDCTGDHVLTIPIPAADISGEYDGTKNNVIQVRCTDDTQGAEKFKCVIFQTNE